MASTSHSDFGHDTEGLDVAAAFASQVRGKTVIVTGVNRGGIGFSTAEAFASQAPAHLIITGRSSSKLLECLEALKSNFPQVDYQFLQFDLSKQREVRRAATELLGWSNIPQVDLLVNSAGVALIPERTITEDGIEMQFATNHIGHYLFTCLIMPKLLKAAEQNPKGATRVINVSSGSPMWCYMRWSDTNFEIKNKDLPDDEKPNFDIHKAWGSPNVEEMAYVPLEAYNQSKVANVLFSIALNKRLCNKHGILALTVHPGWIPTELERTATTEFREGVKNITAQRNISYKTLKSGCSTSLVAALDPKLGGFETKDGKENYGVFLQDCQITNGAHPLAVSGAEAEKLWTLSERLVKETFEW